MTDDNEQDFTIPPDEQGRLAYINGFPMNICPYPDDSEERLLWEGAWMEAEEEGPPL